jgi:hypothetical protein
MELFWIWLIAFMITGVPALIMVLISESLLMIIPLAVLFLMFGIAKTIQLWYRSDDDPPTDKDFWK